jgi:putative aldouronate transport system permease protein
MNSNFDQTLILANQLNFDRSLNIDLYVYRVGIVTGRFSFATAIGTFKSVIALILLIIAGKISKRLTGRSLF